MNSHMQIHWRSNQQPSSFKYKETQLVNPLLNHI